MAHCRVVLLGLSYALLSFPRLVATIILSDPQFTVINGNNSLTPLLCALALLSPSPIDLLLCCQPGISQEPA